MDGSEGIAFKLIQKTSGEVLEYFRNVFEIYQDETIAARMKFSGVIE